jgi:hypothetical protein
VPRHCGVNLFNKTARRAVKIICKSALIFDARQEKSRYCLSFENIESGSSYTRKNFTSYILAENYHGVAIINFNIKGAVEKINFLKHH